MKTVIEILSVHIKYTRQIFKLAKSDLVKTYKGAALGWAWAIIQPAVTLGVYYFAIAIGLRRGGDMNGCPYFLWLCCGMVPWFYMSAMLTNGAGAIRKYSYLVTKIRFPVATIPTIISFSELFTHFGILAIVMVIFSLSGWTPTIYWLQLPFYMALMVMFFSAWALFASMLSVVSKDFMHLVRSMVKMLFWLSGIIYDVDGVKNHTLRRILRLNPVTIIVDGYRNCMVDKVWFWEEPRVLLKFLIIYAFLVLLALWVYKKLVKEIPDLL